MKNRTFTLENLNELQLERKEITVEDLETGELKVIKTVSWADVVCVVAYMLGIENERLEEYYSHRWRCGTNIFRKFVMKQLRFTNFI